MIKVKLLGGNLKNIPIKEIYFTPTYYKTISEKKTKDGSSYLDLIAIGRGAQGFKHLLEKLYESDPRAKIIFTEKCTCKKAGNWYINLDEYKNSVKNKFMMLYRKTGLEAASKYLNSKMPDRFTYEETDMSDNSVKKSIDNLPKIISKVQTKKDIAITLEGASRIVTNLGNKDRIEKPELAQIEMLKKSSNIASIISGIKEFKKRLTESKKYKETSGKDNWQSWLKEHSWIFGVCYSKPYEKTRIGLSSIPDFLLSTPDGFIDLYEIKLPECEIVKEDSNHPGSYIWSPDVNKAIGQCINYLSEIETNRLQLEKNLKNEYDIELSFIKPRAFIIIGTDLTINTQVKKEALKKLNYHLHGIEVITYSDLRRRGEQMLKIYGYDDKI